MAQLSVYIDFKSPYAYLALEPTRMFAEANGIEIDWQPFVLDIPSYLGSARLNKQGKVAQQSRSQEQWSGVKYAYYDCRRYANLRGLTIRGTEKIWDTTLPAIGMLWVKQQGDALLHAYIDAVYEPLWKRELDVEDPAVITRVLQDVGADVTGFDDYLHDKGRQENEMLQHAAFGRGIFGVPTYDLGGDLYFGREHLPRLAWLLGEGGGATPDIANPLLEGDRLPAPTSRDLEVGIDVDSYESLAAIPGIEAIARDTGAEVRWYPLQGNAPSQPDTDGDRSRGARHRQFRFDNYRRDAARYAELADASVVNDLVWASDPGPATWAGAGRLGTPTFRLGDQEFVGRQHLPLIRAMLERA